MWKVTITMNNAAALALSNGHEMKAIECIREALEVLSTVCNCRCGKPDDTRPIGDAHSAGQTGANCLISVTPFANQIHGTICTSAFVYNYGFSVTATPTTHVSSVERRAGHETCMVCLSAIAIYNMALAYHRLALSAQENRHYINSAAGAYMQAISLCHLEIQKKRGGSASESEAIFVIAVASYNNLGQLNCDLLNDHDEARRCFSSVALLTNHMDNYETMMVPPIMSGGHGLEEGYLGILSNLVFLGIVTGTTASAA
jgi:hypothetical protein